MLKSMIVGMVSMVAIGSAAFAASNSRGEVEQSVSSSCQLSQEDCLRTVRSLIAVTVQCPLDSLVPNEGCGCAPNRSEVLNGLGDAAQALAKTDIEIARLIYSAIGTAPSCLASAGETIFVVGSPG